MNPAAQALIGAHLDRRLGWALALSLVVHSLALLPPSLAPSPTGNSSPLRATLHQPGPVQKPIPSAPAGPSVLPEKALTPPQRVLPTEAREKIQEKSPPPAPANPPAPAAENVPAENPPIAAPVQDTALLQPLRPNIDLNGLRQYHLALSHMAARFKRYPPEAREAGMEGRVPLRLVISDAGLPMVVTLIGTSGYDILDQAALQMMGMAASHTPVPESLRGRRFSIDLAVDYSTDDEQ